MSTYLGVEFGCSGRRVPAAPVVPLADYMILQDKLQRQEAINLSMADTIQRQARLINALSNRAALTQIRSVEDLYGS